MEFAWTAAQRQRYEDAFAAARDAFPEERAHSFDRESWRVLGELGLLGACLSPEYGGQGLGALDTARIFEAFGHGCADTGLVFAAAAHLFACAMPIAEFGSPALRERLLRGMAAGELVAGNAMTEADAGSDVGRLSTVAERVDGGYRLTGTKTFVSNGPVADVFVTYAVTDPTAGHFGISAFVVDATAPGVLLDEPLHKLGMDGCAAGAVTFDDCPVPEQNLLGAAGQGSAVFQHSMGWERACLFALYIGLQDRLIEQTVRHVRGRKQFGQRLADFQSVTNRIVDMKVRVESARLLLYRTCWAHDAGEHTVLYAALSKLATSEAALASATDAVQLFGYRGYLRGNGIESALRDAMGSTIFSGASDIQRQLIAIEMGL
ncbi:acyl-CoA dehydrogenase family protein [Nocardia sp. NPDC052112]|uniref:acyl-CoA dehydrogenase family protein n=1 Tax=Nocardia sp. NPDC052112 TaxID=3155646 RepID=UPI003422CDE8